MSGARRSRSAGNDIAYLGATSVLINLIPSFGYLWANNNFVRWRFADERACVTHGQSALAWFDRVITLTKERIISHVQSEMA